MYHHQNRVNNRVVRIFNAYGPRIDPNDGRVVSNFIVQALPGSRSQVVFKPFSKDDPSQRNFDVSLATQRLYWEPATALGHGLKRTIAPTSK